MQRYRFGKILGRGGMATVYEGWRLLANGVDQPVAIKRIRPEHAARREVRARFQREASLCIHLAHPNLVKVYDLDRPRRRLPFTARPLLLVMDRIDGLSVAELGRRTPVAPAIVRLIFMQALCGLTYLHEQDIVHRDISPSNLLVSHRGEVKIADFGLAKVLHTPVADRGFEGNPPYACPEQIRGQDIDPSADLFSLAAVVHELLTGAPPFGAGSLATIGDRQSRERSWALESLDDQVPEDLRAVLQGLLQPRATRAFGSASEVMDALQRYRKPIARDGELAALVRQNMEAPPATEMLPWAPWQPRPKSPWLQKAFRWFLPAMLLSGMLAGGWALFGNPRTMSSADTRDSAPRRVAPMPSTAARAQESPAQVCPAPEPPAHVSAPARATESAPSPATSTSGTSGRSRPRRLHDLPVVSRTPRSIFHDQENPP